MAELLDLKTLTADVSKSSYLERMLDNNAASYKYYWFKGILDEVCAGNTEIAFTRLVARMAAGAWYPIVFFRLHLGASDKLSLLVDYLLAAYHLPRDTKEDAVISTVEANVSTDAKLSGLVADRTRNVPYRIIRPFYEDELRVAKEAVRCSGKKWHDPRTDEVIFRANQDCPEKAIYSISTDKSSLLVSSDWTTFLRENELIIRGWLDYRLTRYLQMRNPSVPAISMKLHPPHQRDLTAATRYWKCAMELCALADIYTKRPFTTENFSQAGSLSIDHFIPWSFVLHNEAWDLIPMFKNTNSSKSDNLPALDCYFEPFCSQQFDAMIAVKDAGLAGKHCKQFDSLRSLDANIDVYVNSDESRQSFEKSLHDVIVPLYQIALNQGYATWEYKVVQHEGPVGHVAVEF